MHLRVEVASAPAARLAVTQVRVAKARSGTSAARRRMVKVTEKKKKKKKKKKMMMKKRRRRKKKRTKGNGRRQGPWR